MEETLVELSIQALLLATIVKEYFQIHLKTRCSPQLSPVATEHDELIEDIEKSTEQPWELVDTPDVQSLDVFWNGVEDDLKHDPTWFSFNND